MFPRKINEHSFHNEKALVLGLKQLARVTDSYIDEPKSINQILRHLNVERVFEYN